MTGAEGTPPPGDDRPIACDQILPSISDPGAGPSYSVRALSTALSRRGVRVRVRTISGWRSQDVNPGPDGFEEASHRQDFAKAPLLRQLCASNDLRRALHQTTGRADILHAHGLWVLSSVYPAKAARATGAKFVLSPRGMLGAEAMAFSRIRKRIFWRMIQESALATAACIHVTSEAEYEDVRRAGLRTPVAVIPNGIDLPEVAAGSSAERREILSLGRIHPKKGLDNLVRAWARIEPLFPAWRLRIVGPSELGHDRELLTLAKGLQLTRISIEPPVFGPAKLGAYRSAGLFVLPTRNENFAMTVAESLAAGTPVICTKGAPWSGLDREGCGWWIDQGVAPLAEALKRAMRMSADELSTMGLLGRAWMARDFGWDPIATDMLALYRWLARGDTLPSTVRLT
jgi:glycosyltransferase involved in cell wall biosynthesis